MVNKCGQFFLLAAVIISAVIISLGFVENRATVNREPGSVSDFSYEVTREAGAVIDFEIYTLENNKDDLELFIGLLAKDIRDRDPDSNFLFLYGDESEMILKNYGSDSVDVDGDEVEGSGAIIISEICSDGTCTSVADTEGIYDSDAGTINVEGEEEIVITVGENDYSFPISKDRQVIFIMQKEIDDENFVSVG